jgi:hypothetical protein
MAAALCTAGLGACIDGGADDDDDIAGEGEGECEDEGVGEWSPMSVAGAPVIDHGAHVVWAGNEDTGPRGSRNETNSYWQGGIYDPSGDQWRAISVEGSPRGDVGWADFGVEVWTGGEMIVWGAGRWTDEATGQTRDACAGGRYAPVEDRWSSVTEDGAPPGCSGASVGWDGRELMVWGGGSGTEQRAGPFGVGARYDPATDSWASMTAEGAPSARARAFGGWTEEGLLVWGTHDGDLTDGALYRPETDSWTPTSPEGAPVAFVRPFGALAGGKLILIYEEGEERGGPPAATSYDPVTETWQSLAPPPVVTQLWAAGDAVFAWSSVDYVTHGGPPASAAIYDRAADQWLAASSCGMPTGPVFDRANLVWTGEELLAFGVDQGTMLAGRFRW